MTKETDELNKWTERLKALCLQLNEELVVYNSQQVCSMLNISDKLLVRYRYDGLLPYSRVGDKYWYTQDDIDSFMRNTHAY